LLFLSIQGDPLPGGTFLEKDPSFEEEDTNFLKGGSHREGAPVRSKEFNSVRDELSKKVAGSRSFRRGDVNSTEEGAADLKFPHENARRRHGEGSCKGLQALGEEGSLWAGQGSGKFLRKKPG